jgi:CRISPR type III-A-associated RAMP protein Csm4
MNPALLFKLRPTTPWRSGSDSGARNRVDSVYHSDSLYAAVTAAMARLGEMDEWLAATATADGAAVRFSSCFPFLEDTIFVIPPRTIWPPAALAARVRWKSARFVPVDMVSALLAGKPLEEERWSVDGVSECLVPAGVPGPFRNAIRWSAAVDRLSGASDRHATACLEFRPGAGLWAIASFADEEQQARWSGRVKAALRVLADSGFGGERSRGWGRSEQPEFVDGAMPDLILPREVPAEAKPDEAPPETPSGEVEQPAEPPSPAPQPPSPDPGTRHWLLSLFSPSAADAVEWDKGNYAVVSRGGRIESPAAYGDLKKQLNMVCEGSVLVAGESLRGAAPDVAPDGFPHPVYRAGFAVSIPIPRQVTP